MHDGLAHTLGPVTGGQKWVMQHYAVHVNSVLPGQSMAAVWRTEADGTHRTDIETLDPDGYFITPAIRVLD